MMGKTAQQEWDDESILIAAEGRKDDGGKASYHLLAPEFLETTAAVLSFGAAKYGARNWERGMAWSRPFAAMMRHMWAWWRGEKTDPETGLSHLHHAACCLMFLVAYEARAAGNDDRPEARHE
jgi:hypothetical protein